MAAQTTLSGPDFTTCPWASHLASPSSRFLRCKMHNQLLLPFKILRCPDLRSVWVDLYLTSRHITPKITKSAFTNQLLKNPSPLQLDLLKARCFSSLHWGENMKNWSLALQNSVNDLGHKSRALCTCLSLLNERHG